MAASKTPLIVAAVVIAVVAGVTLMVRRDAPDPDVKPIAAPADAAVEPGVMPRASAVADRRQQASAGSMSADQLQASLDRRGSLRDAHVARTAQARDEASARFEQEQVDAAWAPGKEVELSALTAQPAFETAGVAPRSLDVDCKSSMCRIAGSFASNGDAEDWVLIYMSSVGSNLPNAIVSRTANPDGTTSVQIYGRGR